MEIEVKNVIFSTVRELILSQQPEKWVSVSTEIYENLNRLNPSACEDGDVGKIAFGPNDKRMKIRTSRFLTRKLHLNSGFLDDVQIRSIQTNIDDILFGDIIKTFISTGSDITKNYSNGVGGSSCMAGCCSNYAKLYENNPDVYSQLIIKRSNDSARAMVVKLDNGRFMLDRIYASAEDLIPKMKAYAKDQNWISGYYGNPGLCGVGSTDLIVTGLSYVNGEVPYQDTLGLGRIRDGLLDLMANSDHDFDFTVDNTDGNIDGGYSCCNCGGHVPEDEYWTFSSEIYCNYCFDGIAFVCEYCEQTASQDNSRYIENEGVHVCSSCAENHYANCDECEQYFSTECIRFIESENRQVCGECLDQYYRECTDCYEFFSMLTELDNGDAVCEDCLEIENQKDIDDCISQLLLPFKDQLCLPLELSLSA